MFESPIQPKSPIPTAATAIYGITNTDVATAPTWPELHTKVCGILEGRLVAIYSAAFDHRLLIQTAALYSLQIAAYRSFCVARAYARYHGEWDAGKGGWKHQHLADAVVQADVDLPDQGRAHRAVFDCHLALGVLQAMATKKEQHKKPLNKVVTI